MRNISFVFALLLIPAPAFAAASLPQLQLLTEQKQYVKVLNLGAEMLQQNPHDAEVLFLLAYANQMTARTDQAVAIYEELIRSHPELPEPRNNLAMIYLAAGDYDQASQLLVEAINTHSSYATAYANLSRVYKGIASEAYRRAVSESGEPAKYTHEIELTAITSLDSFDTPPDTPMPAPAQPTAVAAAEPAKKTVEAVAEPAKETTVAVAEPAKETTVAVAETAKKATDDADLGALLVETVRNWATAWSTKSFDVYTASYTDDYRAKFPSHDQWVEHRRSRIVRPGEIKVVVSKFDVKLRADDRAAVDFEQAFSSPGYSDRVVKRLDFRRIGGQWKITSERVLSVL